MFPVKQMQTNLMLSAAPKKWPEQPCLSSYERKKYMTDRYESPLSTRYASEYMLRLFSADSRYLGFIKEEDILGKAFFRFLPFGSFGSVK